MEERIQKIMRKAEEDRKREELKAKDIIAKQEAILQDQ